MDQSRGFPLRQLPPEILDQIFRSNMTPEPLTRLPPLLLSFSPTKEPQLYQEAKKLYKETNFVVTYRNEKEFMALPMKDMMKIHHITVVLEEIDDDPTCWPVVKPKLRNHKSILQNAFQTVTMDLRRVPERHWSENYGTHSLLHYLVVASTVGVERINIVVSSEQLAYSMTQGPSVTWDLGRREVKSETFTGFEMSRLGQDVVYTWRKTEGIEKRKLFVPPTRHSNATLKLQ
ncbi:uncharacterized protein LY89DRAFT_736971 [Mollisia scopiformis]|uniref:Uncharacterized protein n=1 Tax=Mollisia scopiformis TaxID=149040 RepID=A0A194X1A3_MOLSC|nr:uncharacterized protein LY89DRAFT_736971 [Mollisia scopiformis]KUJ13968.1 hypothetical protein LY89DRAFT_736971 [Mollisia scopiformis]